MGFLSDSLDFTKDVISGKKFKDLAKSGAEKFGPAAGVVCGPFAPACSAAAVYQQQKAANKAAKKQLKKLQAQQAKSMLTNDTATGAIDGGTTESLALIGLGVLGVVLVTMLRPGRKAAK